MIVSFEHKFIFIKTAKTAGTSIEIALSKFCGDSDILTPLVPKDEEKRLRHAQRGCQNYVVPFSKYTLCQYWLAIRLGRRAALKNHDSLSMVKRLFGIDPRDFYVFAVERHPLAKLRSLADYWGEGAEFRRDPETWLKKRRNFPKPQGWELYTDGHEIVADRIFNFENLAVLSEDLNLRFGFNLDLGTTWAKKSESLDRTVNWSPAALEIVQNMYQKEIAAFGYDLADFE